MKTRYFILAAVASLAMVSCNESVFLDNPPQATVSEELLMTPEGSDQLCMAAYAALMGPHPQDWSVCWYPVTHWSTGSVRADDAYKGGGGTGDGWETHRLETFTLDATDPVSDSKWFHLCVSIQRCNSALRVLNKCTEEQVPLRDRRIAEMKVLRAHYFFELQRMYNQIPWYDENMDDATVQTTPNNEFTREELLDKIAQEISSVLDDLPETQPEVGRVNRYMAKAYLAKVLLYRAYEQNPQTHAVVNVDRKALEEVVSLCKDIRNSGRYDLFDDFQELDLVSSDNGKECIWDIQFSMNDGSNSAGRVNWSNLLNSPGGNSPYHGDGFFLPSQDLINAYQTDESGLPVFDYQSRPDYGVVEFIDEQHQKLSNTEPTVDPRLDFVVGRPTITYKTYRETPCQSWVRDRGVYGHNCAKRFWVSPESPDMFQGWPWGASQLNWQIIRYADLLLYKAEALIEIGEDLETARQLINRVRQRAANSQYVKDFNDPSKDAANYKIGLYPAAGWTQAYARQALRTEMRLEKALEGERYFDLVRWGIASDVMTKYFDAEKDNRAYYQTAKFDAGEEYFPIPVAQYNFSLGKYTQNPGYPAFK